MFSIPKSYAVKSRFFDKPIVVSPDEVFVNFRDAENEWSKSGHEN